MEVKKNNIKGYIREFLNIKSNITGKLDAMEDYLKEQMVMIVRFFNLQRDIIPIINTYTKQHRILKERLQGFKNELMELDINDNLDEKKQKILFKYSSDIELLNKLALELNGSRNFITSRYEELKLGKIDPLPSISTGIDEFDKESEGSDEFVDRSAEQLAAFEATKKSLDPMNIAKYYKDMIFNILN